MIRNMLLSGVICLLLLSGCGTRLSQGKTEAEYSPRYQEQEQNFASTWMNHTFGPRNIITSIQGNPFHMDKEVFDLVTAQVLTAQTPGPRMMFQPKTYDRDLPGQAPREQYHFVIVFNPLSPVSGQDLCAGAEVPTGETTNGQIATKAAFCRGATFLSGASSRMSNVGSVRDRGFSRIVSNTTSPMFRRKQGDFAKGDNYDTPYDTTNHDSTWSCERWLNCGLNNRVRSPDF